MNRRTVLAISAIGISAPLSGCSFAGSSPAEPREFPEIPDELNDQSAVQFATEYEATTGHNERIREADEVLDVDYDCDGALERETGNAFYAIVQCTFSIETRDEGGRSTGEGITDPTLYFLTEEEFIRAETERIDIESPIESDSDDHRGIRFVNLSEEERTVVIDIASADDGGAGSETLFSDDYIVSSQTGLTLERVAERDETYIVTVKLDDGSAVTHEWEVPGRDGPDLGSGWSGTEINLGAYVLPDGKLEIRDIPEAH